MFKNNNTYNVSDEVNNCSNGLTIEDCQKLRGNELAEFKVCQSKFSINIYTAVITNIVTLYQKFVVFIFRIPITKKHVIVC